MSMVVFYQDENHPVGFAWRWKVVDGDTILSTSDRCFRTRRGAVDDYNSIQRVVDRLTEERTGEVEETYSIVRFFADDREQQVVVRGLTLEQVKAHCNRPDTRGEDWFDGFTPDEEDK